MVLQVSHAMCSKEACFESTSFVSLLKILYFSQFLGLESFQSGPLWK